MDDKIHNKPKIKSIIKNNKSILMLLENNTIDSSGFSGINFLDYENLFYAKNKQEILKFKNTHFDYCIVHGFYLYDFIQFNNLNIFKENNITFGELIIDLLGEGFSLPSFLDTLNHKSFFDKINCKIKIACPFNHFSDIENKYPNIDFFRYNLGGPRIFCSRHNRDMIHQSPYINQVVAGLKWSDSKKSKLYMCLNNEPRPHRVLMYNELIKNNLVELGHVSFRDDSNEQMIEFQTKNGNNFQKLYKVPQLLIDGDYITNQFGLHEHISRDSYIELVTESSHNPMPFKTEKCVKPFYNLQFPIIFGHQGIVKDLRNEGFDMFDDIIDHSYDEISIPSIKYSINWDAEVEPAIIKSKMISNEIYKLSTIDIHSLYLDCKERFLYNQELLYKKTIIENNILKDLGKFIFGDNIIVEEFDLDKVEKVYV